MDNSQLAALMLQWEQVQRQADALRAQIEAAVLSLGKTQTVGNVRATFSNTLGLAIGYQEAEIAELTARAEAAEAEVARLREQVAALRALMAQSVIELSAVRIALCIFPWESITDEVRRLVVQNDSLREQVAALRALMAQAVQADLDDDAFALEAVIAKMADALGDSGEDARGG